MALINAKAIEGVITLEQAANIELQLAKELKFLNNTPALYEDIFANVRMLNSKIEGEAHASIVNELKNLKTNNKLIENE